MNRTEWLASLSASACPDIEECIKVLGDNIDWLHLLKDAEQDIELDHLINRKDPKARPEH